MRNVAVIFVGNLPPLKEALRKLTTVKAFFPKSQILVSTWDNYTYPLPDYCTILTQPDPGETEKKRKNLFKNSITNTERHLLSRAKAAQFLKHNQKIKWVIVTRWDVEFKKETFTLLSKYLLSFDEQTLGIFLKELTSSCMGIKFHRLMKNFHICDLFIVLKKDLFCNAFNIKNLSINNSAQKQTIVKTSNYHFELFNPTPEQIIGFFLAKQKTGLPPTNTAKNYENFLLNFEAQSFIGLDLIWSKRPNYHLGVKSIIGRRSVILHKLKQKLLKKH
jgi:hypothetical protein